MSARAPLVAASIFGVLACKSEPVPTSPPPTPPLAVTASAPTPRVDAALGVASTSVDASVAAPQRLAATGCKVDADCVLTAEPTGCCTCPFDHEYPASKHALDAHEASCASADCKMPSGCPPVVRYQPAFERAECREARCVVVRWHSGG